VIALAILAVTLFLVLRRPRGLPESVGACAGAALALAAGAARPADALSGVRDTAGILVFLVATMVLAALADAAGVFHAAARLTLLTARGRGWLLYANVYLLGAAITLLLSLDVTAVVLTPLVCALLLPLRLDARPFVFAAAFVANTASLALPVSNLTNMLVYDLLGVGFWDFVRYLALPNVVALVVNLGLLLWFFRHQIPGDLRVSVPTVVGHGDPWGVATAAGAVDAAPFFRWSAGALGVTALALLVSGAVGWPFWPAALAGASLLTVASLANGWTDLGHVRRHVAWGLPPFVIGMYVVVAGVYRALEPALAGLPAVVGALSGPLPLLATAVGTAVGANAVNNLPLSLAAIQLLRTVPAEATGGMAGVAGVVGAAAVGVAQPLRDTLAYGTLIGVNLGPNLTVTGSLATMLCLAAARARGVRIGALEFARVGLVCALPPLVASALTLWVLLRVG
jgi:arsenical pump membrane protein